MKTPTILPLALLPLISTTAAWTFTWTDVSGDTTTESGTGPSECISVHHEQGQLFTADGEDEPNINMLLFTNDECTGEPAGMATEFFSKESSVDLLGFQVVELGGNGNGTATTTAGSDTETGTTMATATSGSSATATSTRTDDDETDTDATMTRTETNTSAETGTMTLPTADPSETEDGTESSTTDSASTPSADPSETEDDAEPAPTDAASALMLSRTGLVGIAVGILVGGWALEFMF